MRPAAWLCAVLAAASAGCAMNRDDIGGRDFDSGMQETEVRIRETRTLSALAKLESALADYYKAEGHVPPRLEALIPRYLGEMPSVETGVRGHRDTSRIKNYPSSIFRQGQIDPQQLMDSGRWGYAYSAIRAVVFVDCTHVNTRGNPWFKERGVY